MIIILFFSLFSMSTFRCKIERSLDSDLVSGFDHRYLYKNDTDNAELLVDIRRHFAYKKLLTQLETNKISETDKVQVIRKNDIFHLCNTSKYAYNYKAGDLMKDFDFEFDFNHPTH